MEIFLLISHASLALLILVVVLLQQGKGAEMGASFGAGSSQTLFGSQGSGSFFVRLTAIIMALFFATSLALTIIAKGKANFSYEDQGLAPLIEDQRENHLPDLPTNLPTMGTDNQTTDTDIKNDNYRKQETKAGQTDSPSSK